MADRRFFVDIFDEIVAEVRSDYDEVNTPVKEPYYMYGHAREIANRLDLKDRLAVEKFGKFPLIWLVTDLQETAGEFKDVLYELAPFRVFIIDSTKATYTSEERTEKTFKPIANFCYLNSLI